MFKAVAPVLYTIGGPARLSHVTVDSRPKFPVQNAHEADSELCFEMFPKQMSLVTNWNSFL